MTTTLATISTHARVTEAYRTTYPDPLILRMGEHVTVVAHDTEWPDYVWCTSAAGKGGWVPKSYLVIQGADGAALRDYSARELTVIAGEELTLIDEEGGWYWAENALGERGWLPAENLQLPPR